MLRRCLGSVIIRIGLQNRFQNFKQRASKGSEESEEIVDLRVRRLVRAFLDCKSWLRIFTISLNKMTMGNRKKLLFHYLTRHSLGMLMFCDSEPYRPCK